MIINKITQTIYGMKSYNIPAGRKTNLLTSAGDIVAFSGKSKPQTKEKQISPNVLKAVELADKLTQIPMQTPFSLDLISSIIAQDLPDITISPINELEGLIYDSQNYGAFYTGILTPDFNITDETMYLNNSKADISDVYRFSVIKDTAHEYTHAMQMKNGITTNFLKTVTKGDYEYAKAIQGLGDIVFKPIDNEIQAYSVMKVFRNPYDLISNQKYGFFYPREQEVSKQDVLDSLGLKNEKEFKALILQQFDKTFNTTVNSLLSDPVISAMIPERNYNKLKNKIKAYCQISAVKEKEAYTSESIISKKYLKTDKSINLDIFPIYYSMVADALKNN